MSNSKGKSNIPHYDFSEYKDQILIPYHPPIFEEKDKGICRGFDRNRISLIKNPAGLLRYAKKTIHAFKD